MDEPRLTWSAGTAYDLFVSLYVLHTPEFFGVRPAWAAGMRARLPQKARATLEQGRALNLNVLNWVYDLPEPRDGVTALDALAQIPAAERLSALVLSPYSDPRLRDALQNVAARGTWQPSERQVVAEVFAPPQGRKDVEADIDGLLALWSQAETFGEAYLPALRDYHDAFFAEEERRIGPALSAALERARGVAGSLPLDGLVEELSQGVAFEDAFFAQEEIVLAPSYWCTPIVILATLGGGRTLLLFGARSLEASLAPGERVPDTLVGVLKALADPTRLQILRYLMAEALTPTQLSRRLRLRTATVSHHLKVLRLAGLVGMSVQAGVERSYAARPAAVQNAYAILLHFLETV